MPKKLEEINAKRCITASGWLVKDGKVLLIKHKMLGIWLAPGGHVEENELPHQAAVREFLEETGIQTTVLSAYPVHAQVETQNLPMPFICNLHWINRPGEVAKKRYSGKTCEQHYVWGYFLDSIGSLDIDDSDLGVEAIQWFSEDEIDALQTTDTIRSEAHYVFAHHPNK